MKFGYLTYFFAVIMCACTMSPQADGTNTQFQPPLVYQQWKSEHYTLQNGTKACAISSGYNGLTVFISGLSGGGEDIAVQGTRSMKPGSTLSVNVNGDNYQTDTQFFSAKIAQAMVKDFEKGGKAYLEWSEFSGPSSWHSPILIQNMVRLDDFGKHLKECHDSLK